MSKQKTKAEIAYIRMWQMQNKEKVKLYEERACIKRALKILERYENSENNEKKAN